MDQARVKPLTPAQNSTNATNARLNSALPRIPFARRVEQGRQEDAHHRCIDAQQGMAHRSPLAQITPEGQESSNQQKRKKASLIGMNRAHLKGAADEGLPRG